ncbi:hypothetical protein MMC25_006974 [Agyrium rufum]|nr:hypothetical protein [Agyrium rufum]
MSGTNVQDIQGSTSAVPSHKSPVLGISLLAGSDGRANGYLTWSADGMIMFWTGPYACKRRIHLPVTEEISEDNTGLAMLKSIKQLSTEAVLLIGDSMGTLRICSIASQIDDEHPFGETALFSPHNIDYTTVAHDGEIMDICCTIFGGNQHIIMTAGRDRTIQAYLRNSSGSTDLVQTIKQHTSAVTQVMVTKSGGILVSSSADRTVIIHTLACTDSAIAYIPIRTLALKAASLAMNLESMDPEFFFISTSDKQLHRYSMSESSLTKGLRIIGQEKEAQNLTRMTMHDLSFGNNNYNLILGVSTSDNTVKIVSSETGRTIAKEHANCEGITGCVMLPALNQDGHRTCNIITAGLDGTVMAWTIRQDTQGKNGIVKGIDSFSSTPKLGPPIRRILSRSKLAEFAKVLDARGDVSLPTTPIRNSSPSRPSNKAPRNTIVKTELSSTATARNTKYDPPLEAMDASSETTPPQSPSHKRPTCRGGTIKRPSLIDGYRTRSASNIHAHAMNHCMKQLCQQLRGFREEISKASKNYDTDLRNNLMQELRTTMNLLSDSTPELEYHMNGQLGELLDRYSTRLTKLVEEKISDAAPKIINSSDPIDTSSVHDTVPGRSPLARDSPTP